MNGRGKLVYPAHRFKPEDLLTFIELKPFTRLWNHLKLTDDDLSLVQLAIMCEPKAPPVIEDCAGVRKIRFSPRASGKGKSGSMRCCYKYFEEHKVVALAIVYPKGTKEDISEDDKSRIRRAIQEIERELDR
ncbi:MAG: hypothetical protein U0872_02625 [Planctomycetaceae bacterium]